ncbi:MAG: hypothetical protein OMM_04545 [Candidatus Magnetoglobus multicellularis str. Araruama]|uniref:ATPase domain protein, prokaryote domain protein n=1 Tax=Candidatus Magnetoglobus multicellularis str. Araruama TaxID=890399 RepID=A0A1V1P0Z0_9BACT|nr:MAG: hypothetical protein OMM_04545 [Candidatus Magnetoglobus multicellularis str. Araruama]
MQYSLEERIGDPFLFCGREKEMTLLLDWISRIPKKLSKSQAILGRRKSGKTAIMQRLFNILWSQNGKVIPFYFEVLDQNQWILQFADEYFRTFLSQYLSFEKRMPLESDNAPFDWETIHCLCNQLNNERILENLQRFNKYYDEENTHSAIMFAFGAPVRFAQYTGKFFLVMIDEIQYMTEYIFHDQERKIKAYNLPGAFHGLVEIKSAPMLVAGSYIGWMTQMMRKMFVGSRLRPFPVSPKLDEKGGLEAVFKYAETYNIQLTDEIANVINMIIQSDPFYMTALFSSPFRDFSSVEGVIQTFVEEISNKKGELYLTWMEYIDISLKKVNDKYGKQILLILSKNRYQKMGRDEILKKLDWSEERDAELQEKLLALEYGGLIESTSSNYHYQGIPDDILDLIFRERYQYEIYKKQFNMASELKKRVKELEQNNRSLKGQVNELKGRMLEVVLWRELNTYRKKGTAISGLENRFRPMPDHLKNAPFLTSMKEMSIGLIYLNYFIQSPETAVMELDLLVEGTTETGYQAIVFEIKNRDEKNCPTDQEVKLFVQKIEVFEHALKRMGHQNICLFPVFLSANGFEGSTEKWLHEQNVFTADMNTWMED